MLAQLAPAWVSASSVAADSTNKGSPVGTILLIVVVIAFIGFLVLNGRRRSRVVQAAQSEIAIGSTVVTRAGLIATLIDRNEHFVVLQLEDGTRARFVPAAVARVWMEPEPEDSSEGEPPTAGGPLAD